MALKNSTQIVCIAVALTMIWSCGDGQTKQERWIAAAKEVLSAETGTPVEEIEVSDFEEVVWADSGLGCPEPGVTNAQVIEKGYRIVLVVDGGNYTFHGSESKEPFLCQPGALKNGSFTAELNGFKIHYEVHGRGPVVMAVPNSWGLDITGIRGVFRGLEARVTLVYFDPRGMGSSDPALEDADMSMQAVREDFNALRQFLSLAKVHAIGWSNGAGNLILLAAEYPETLRSAIFVHGVASYTEEDAVEFSERFPDLTSSYMAFMQEMADESLTDTIRTERLKDLWLTEFFPLQMADPEAGLDLIRTVFGDAEFSWAHGQVANRESMGFDTREMLPTIPVRSLVIAGAHDMSPPNKVKELADGLGDSVYVLFDNSGHFSSIEEPERFESIVFEFLGVE